MTENFKRRSITCSKTLLWQNHDHWLEEGLVYLEQRHMLATGFYVQTHEQNHLSFCHYHRYVVSASLHYQSGQNWQVTKYIDWVTPWAVESIKQHFNILGTGILKAIYMRSKTSSNLLYYKDKRKFFYISNNFHMILILFLENHHKGIRKTIEKKGADTKDKFKKETLDSSSST